MHNITPLNLTSSGEYYYKLMLGKFFKVPIDGGSDRYDFAVKRLVDWASKCEWFRIFDLLEFLFENDRGEERDDFVRECNEIFEEEKVGYRFVNGQITPIVDKVEIDSIENILKADDIFAGARAHIARAMELYSDRKKPDYRNSIKEAISAVESVCRVIAGKKRASLGDAIKVIEKKHSLHPALKESLLKLYGYSSDKEGIRHALMADSAVGHAEAKLMLVGCSAFCNFMIEQYGATAS